MTALESLVTLPQGAARDRRLPFAIWLLLFASLALWTANRFDAFDIWNSVRLPDGSTVEFPNVFATVDHPFHASRAELLLRSLRDGYSLRWVASHQGGYPVEFYPLGVAGLEVALWGLLLGSLPMLAVHKLAVILIFLVPGLAYALAAKRDRLPLGVGLLALATHLVVRGWWWSGGSYELIEWGLVTNVAAAVAAIFALVFITSFLTLETGSPRDAALASLSGAFCLYANPRSGIALVIAGLGALLAVLSATDRGIGVVKRVTGRLALVAALVALISAPEWMSLIRFEDLYYFVHYERYADLRAYWDSSIQAVSGPVFVLGLVGVVAGLALPRRPITRAFACTLVLYCAVTAYLSSGSGRDSLVEQLETTRLMPFQRLLMVFLAAVAIHDLAVVGWRALPRFKQLATDTTLVAIAGLLPVLYVIAPPSWVPLGDRGLVSVPSAATPAVADLREAVRFADSAAASGTAILVLGSPVSWHANLWAPVWSDRPFFYDDWLWDWQTKHVGPYNPLTEHAYRPADMAEVLEPDYLTEHGIGAILIAETARTATAARAVGAASNLELARSGIYSVYVVRSPSTIVTVDGVNASSVAVANRSISAQVTSSSGGVATIRRTWFPRWRASVNGDDVPLTQTADGYITMQVPSGESAIVLTYVVDGWDWVARVCCVLGLVVALLFGVAPRSISLGMLGRVLSGVTPNPQLARR